MILVRGLKIYTIEGFLTAISLLINSTVNLNLTDKNCKDVKRRNITLNIVYYGILEK